MSQDFLPESCPPPNHTQSPHIQPRMRMYKHMKTKKEKKEKIGLLPSKGLIVGLGRLSFITSRAQVYFIQQHTHAAKARKTKHRYGRRELAPRNVDLAQSHVVVDCEHL